MRQKQLGQKACLAPRYPPDDIRVFLHDNGVSPKEVWRRHLYVAENKFPKQLPADAIVFYAQGKGPFYEDELDAMWVALKHGVKTLNGYSGLLPPGFSLEYGNDCAEVPHRVLSYLTFNGQNGNSDAFRELMQRIVPVGFEGCDALWSDEAPPTITKTDHEYTADEFRQLSYQFGKKRVNGNNISIELQIINSGEKLVAAQSGLGKPIRISWRFLDVKGNPVTGWENRKDLPFDIPAHGSITARISIDPRDTVKGGSLQVSLVQELVFWAHDIGMQPINIAWE